MFQSSPPIIIPVESNQKPIQQSTHQEWINPEIKIEWKHKRYLFEQQLFEYSGGVTLFYEGIKITAEKISINLENHSAHAEQNVQIIDSQGTLKADELQWNWKLHTGFGKNIHANTAGIQFKIETIELTKQKANLQQIRFELAPAKVIIIESSLAEYDHLKTITFHHSKIRVLGIPIQIDYKRFLLDKSDSLIQLPTIGFKNNGQFSLGWSPKFTINNRLLFTPSVYKSSNKSTTILADLEYSLCNQVPTTPLSDLEDPFSSSHLDNITVEDSEQELNFLKQKKTIVGFSWAKNLETTTRKSNINTIQKPFESHFEIGGEIPAIFSARYQSIKTSKNHQLIKRWNLNTSAIPIYIQPNSQTIFTLRIDAQTFFNNDKSMHWARILAGTHFHINENYSCSTGISFGKQWGTPHFEFDELKTLNQLHFRFNYQNPAYIVSYLLKYDLQGKYGLQHQVKCSGIWGAFEPFIIYKTQPNSLAIGLELRLKRVIQSLQIE